jgi:hypothetical protein
MNFNIFKDNPAIWLIIIMFAVGCTVIFLGSLGKYRSDKKDEKKKDKATQQ